MTTFEKDIWEVRKATYLFLKDQPYQSPILELSPMLSHKMPYPEWFVDLSHHPGYSAVWSEEEFFDLEPQPVYQTIIAANVLEHCRWIQRFPLHCQYLLKPGGKVYIFVPYRIRFHGPPPDLWRFTDTGLNYLMREYERESMTYYGKDNDPFGLGAIYVLTKR